MVFKIFNLIIHQIIWENSNIIIYKIASFPLMRRTFIRILFIPSTCKVGPGTSSILERLAHAMIWCQDEKAVLEICSGFDFQWFKRFLRIRLCMIIFLSWGWDMGNSQQAGLLNPLVYPTILKLLLHSSTFYSSSNSMNEGHRTQSPF